MKVDYKINSITSRDQQHLIVENFTFNIIKYFTQSYIRTDGQKMQKKASLSGLETMYTITISDRQAA